jgi:hypothetical protein
MGAIHLVQPRWPKLAMSALKAGIIRKALR